MMDFAPLARLVMPPDAGDRIYGVTVGIVTNNQDPAELGRVKVQFPWLSDSEESHWARVATPMAGAGRGLYCLPEVDDEVLVAFEHGRPDFPYVVGALWNGRDAPPETNADGENNTRTLKSRSGHTIRLDDTNGNETIEIIDASAQNSITIHTADNSITLSAQGDITLQSSSGKLILQGNGIEINSQTDIALTAGPEISLQAGVINLN